MKIKREIIDQVKSVKVRRKISDVLDISDATMLNHLKTNASDGILTKLVTLRMISKLTGLPIDELIDEENGEVVSIAKTSSL